ncbi:MAG: rhomboid family intramembrane serine protease [Acidilobaceae archaeon]
MVLRALTRAPVTLALVAINVAVYALASYESLFLVASSEWIDAFAFTPTMLMYPSDWYRVFTSMFMHASLFHILFNMYFLIVFGRDVEERLGSFRYLLLYLASGILASVFHSGLVPITGSLALVVPAVGASGAISGVLGAYLIMFPRRSMTLCLFIPVPICARMYAGHFLLFWLSLQVAFGLLSYGTGGGGIAFFAHVGGFLAGVLLAFLLAPRQPAVVRLDQLALEAPVVAVARKTGLPLLLKAVLAVIAAVMAASAAYSAYVAESISGVYVIELKTEGMGLVEQDKAIYSLSDNMVISPSSSGPRVVFNRLLWAGLLSSSELAGRTLTGVIFDGVIRGVAPGVDIKVVVVGSASYDERGVLSSLEGVVVTDVLLMRMGRVVGVEEGVSYKVSVSSEDLGVEAGRTVVRLSAIASAIVTLAALAVALVKDRDLAEEEVEYVLQPGSY